MRMVFGVKAVYGIRKPSLLEGALLASYRRQASTSK
jgi:hypothetical protein